MTITHAGRAFRAIARWSSLVSVVLVLGFAIAGCGPDTAPGTDQSSADAPGASDELVTLIDTSLTEAESDFQREVLMKAKETGEISEADWKEANNRYKECLASHGYSVELRFEGSKVLTLFDVGLEADESEAAAAERDKVSAACYQKTSAFINEIYAHLNGGDEARSNDNVQRAILDCLVERELVPADTTYEEFVADLEQNNGKQFAPQEGQPNGEAIAQCWIENT